MHSQLIDKSFDDLREQFNQPINSDVSAQKIKVIELRDFLATEFPPRELILSPWLPKAGLCMIHAYRGVGKTHMSLGIAYAVAKGGEFLGWQSPKPRSVLYIDGEMPAAVLQERLARIVKMYGDDALPGKLYLITPDMQPAGMPDLATLEGQVVINQFITDEIDLIIVDNLSCLARSMKENDANDWAAMQTWVLSQRARGKSVLLIHHSGKGGAQRGSSKKEDVLDTVIALERPKDYESSQGSRFIIRYEKARGFFGEEAKPFEAQLCEVGKDNFAWQTKALDESNYEKIITMLNDGMKQNEIVIELGIDKSNVSRYASKARQEGKLHISQEGGPYARFPN